MEDDATNAEGALWIRRSAEQGYLPAMNDRAWRLATHPDATVRDGTEAVNLALRVCEEGGWASAEYVDTLAAAYAEEERWEDAITTQELAIEKLAENDPGGASFSSRLQKYMNKEKTRD